MRILLPILAAVGALLVVAPASAKDTVECISKSYKYVECNSGPLDKPVLIYQSSDADCVMNRTWGFSPRDKYIWVSDGCSGVFADSNGYHHGKADSYDQGARSYDSTGHDAGLLIGALLGAAILDNMDDKDKSHNKSKDHYSSNRDRDNERYSAPSDYDGCHGIGCLVDNPDE